MSKSTFFWLAGSFGVLALLYIVFGTSFSKASPEAVTLAQGVASANRTLLGRLMLVGVPLASIGMVWLVYTGYRSRFFQSRAAIVFP
jgi:hypothetical protein